MYRWTEKKGKVKGIKFENKWNDEKEGEEDKEGNRKTFTRKITEEEEGK